MKTTQTVAVFARQGTASAQWNYGHVVSSARTIMIKALVRLFNSRFCLGKFSQGCPRKRQGQGRLYDRVEAI
jgi:hypothetical protein